MSALQQAVAPEPASAPPLRARFRWDWYTVGFALLVLFAGLLRFWDLGPRAMHHDESLHALYSWYLYVRGEYKHDPLMHGPFQFHIIALMYFLLGASEYAARTAPALFGTIAVALPYFLRPWLGRWGALATSAILAFSPLMLYYSRFARGDVYVVVWDLLMVVAMWRYFQSEDRRFLWLGAAALSLAFATKEVTYLTALIFGGYLLVVTARELWPRIKGRLDLRSISPPAAFLIVFWTLVIPQGAAAILLVLGWLGVDLAALGAWQDPTNPEIMRFAYQGSDPAVTFLLIAATLLPLFALTAAIAWRWSLRLWLEAAAFFYIPFLLLYTTFLTNMPGFGSGIWGGLEYWIAQQPVARGSQPWFYYFLLLSVYEFLPVVLAVAGAVVFFWRRFRPHPSPLPLGEGIRGDPLAEGEGKRGDPFAGFLLWWIAGSLVLYAYAGEKMPWLTLHLLLPVILLAGKTAGDLGGLVPWCWLWTRRSIFLLPLVLLAVFALRAVANVVESMKPGPTLTGDIFQAVGATLVLVVILAAIYRLTQRLPLRAAGWALGVGVVAVMAAFTIRAAWQASYLHGDIPVEIMVYTQTSPEVPKILQQIERIAAESGQGKNMPITVDANQGFTWPWAWYLRDYKNVDYPDLNGAQSEPRGSVLLLNANNQRTMEPFLTKYENGVRYPHRWWFPELYKEGDPLQQVLSLFTADGMSRVWKYFYARDLGAPLGSSDGVVYYPTGSLVDGGGGSAPVARATESPVRAVSLTAELAIGGRGTAAGLQGPKGVAVDGQGNVYVSDSEANRISKLDPAGNLLAQQGRRGSADGEFTEPWGIAVDGSGNVYVADTWNHRVQKFDSNLRYIAKWGSFASVPGGGPANAGSFYGPRAIAVDATGSVYVTDTGNKRVQQFSSTGEFQAAFGATGRGPMQFQEPVGIAVAPSGEILVADTWNRRIQRFDREFRYLAEFPVAAWAGQGVTNKPYLAADWMGNIVITDPESQRIMKYTGTGALINVYGRAGTDLSSFNAPAAVAIDGQGRVFVSDSGNARVLRFPPLE